MPTYEYQCTACGEASEIWQKINDLPIKICPFCKKTKLERLISATGFQLKGTGWYVTDFKNNQKKADNTVHSAETAKLQENKKSEKSADTTLSQDKKNEASKKESIKN